MQVFRVTSQWVLGLGVVLALASNLGCPPATQGPLAAFDASVQSGEAPLAVEFHDRSTAGSSAIVVWSWSFGDGGSSDQQDPVHTYTEPGFYDVRLTVSTANGSSSVLKNDYVHVVSAVVEDNDRVGLVLASAHSETTGRSVDSSAFFVSADLEQLSSLGYVGATVVREGHGSFNLVEGYDSDEIRLVTEEEVMSWITPGEEDEETGEMAWSGAWNLPGLDAGAAGTITAGSQTSSMLPWEWTDDNYFGSEAPPVVGGVYFQENLLTVPAATSTAAFSWPGGADLGAIAGSVKLPAPLEVLSPFTAVASGSAWEDGIEIDRIDTTKAFTLTWEPSGVPSSFVQILVIARASTGPTYESDDVAKFAFCKAVDDGSFTIPQSMMAQLPAQMGTYQYMQEVVVSRFVSNDVSVPLAGGGNGYLRLSGNSDLLIGLYDTEPSGVKVDVHRPLQRFLKGLKK